MLRDGQHWHYRHEVLSLAFLDWIAPNLSETEQKWVLAAIVSHHRDASEIARKYDERMNPDPLISLLAELDEQVVRLLWRWLDECANAWIDTLNLYSFGVRLLPLVSENHAVQITCIEGVQRTRIWLDKYQIFIGKLRSEREQQIIATLVMLRGLTTTADHMASAHLLHVPQGIQRSWEHLAYDELKINTYSHQRVSAANHNTSAMLIAPTGSGKTEAALFWALGDGTEPTPRIFYALPYQASMNAMYDRLRSPFYFGDTSVGLQHGRALQALYQRLIKSEGGPKSARQDAKWRKNLTKLHASPVKVFSPYQMLKVVYQIKGFEGMLTDYMQAAFIFDEIHAYDPGRLAIILCLVKHLREHYGARFFIMSATFPSILQDILSDVLDIQEPIVDAALLEKLPNGRVELIHSRFTMGDRLEREAAIRTRCELGVSHQAFAVVATQVVEVSLNIDLDTIYTDPAPLDALVQRFGRINRAREKGIVPVHVFRQPANGQHVYEDILVKKTLDVLEEHKNGNIDEAAISNWLNEIYSDPEIYIPWKKKYNDQYNLVVRLLHDLRPFNSDEKSEEAFEKLFDGVEVLPQCFERQYLNLIINDEFIEASRLFVSISQKKYEQLARQGKIHMLESDRSKRWLVMQPYSSQYGLLFDSSLSVQPDWD